MSRHAFGQTIADYAIADGGGGAATLAAGAVITFWDAETGGSQLTDLATDAAGTSPVASVTTADGTGDLARGTWPLVYGPDGVTQMWASADDGPRQLVVTQDLAAIVAAAIAGDFTANFLAKGDLVSGSGAGAVARLAAGTDGQVLKADSAATGGLSWADLPAAPTIPVVIPLSLPEDSLTVAAGTARVYNDFGADLTIDKVRVHLATGPTGAAAVFDVNLDGASIFAATADQPTVADGANTGLTSTIATTTWPDGHYLTVDVDQIGSTVAGGQATILIWAHA